MTSTAAVADPPLKIVPVEQMLEAERSWWERHSLNAPSLRVVVDHSWPWFAVAAMLAVAKCWWGLAFPLTVVALILLLAWATHHRSNDRPTTRHRHP